MVYWNYSSAHSESQYWLETSGQLHTNSCFPHPKGKKSPVLSLTEHWLVSRAVFSGVEKKNKEIPQLLLRTYPIIKPIASYKQMNYTRSLSISVTLHDIQNLFYITYSYGTW
jgi:hypothetical protein